MSNLLTSALSSKLKQYIKNFSRETFQIQLFKGRATLSNIELKERKIQESINLPPRLIISKAFCSSLLINIPLRHIKTRPIEVEIGILELAITQVDEEVNITRKIVKEKRGLPEEVLENIQINIQEIRVSITNRPHKPLIGLLHTPIYDETLELSVAMKDVKIFGADDHWIQTSIKDTRSRNRGKKFVSLFRYCEFSKVSASLAVKSKFEADVGRTSCRRITFFENIPFAIKIKNVRHRKRNFLSAFQMWFEFQDMDLSVTYDEWEMILAFFHSMERSILAEKYADLENDSEAAVGGENPMENGANGTPKLIEDEEMTSISSDPISRLLDETRPRNMTDELSDVDGSWLGSSEDLAMYNLSAADDLEVDGDGDDSSDDSDVEAMQIRREYESIYTFDFPAIKLEIRKKERSPTGIETKLKSVEIEVRDCVRASREYAESLTNPDGEAEGDGLEIDTMLFRNFGLRLDIDAFTIRSLTPLKINTAGKNRYYGEGRSAFTHIFAPASASASASSEPGKLISLLANANFPVEPFETLPRGVSRFGVDIAISPLRVYVDFGIWETVTHVVKKALVLRPPSSDMIDVGTWQTDLKLNCRGLRVIFNSDKFLLHPLPEASPFYSINVSSLVIDAIKDAEEGEGKEGEVDESVAYRKKLFGSEHAKFLEEFSGVCERNNGQPPDNVYNLRVRNFYVENLLPSEMNRPYQEIVKDGLVVVSSCNVDGMASFTVMEDFQFVFDCMGTVNNVNVSFEYIEVSQMIERIVELGSRYVKELDWKRVQSLIDTTKGAIAKARDKDKDTGSDAGSFLDPGSRDADMDDTASEMSVASSNVFGADSKIPDIPAFSFLLLFPSIRISHIPRSSMVGDGNGSTSVQATAVRKNKPLPRLPGGQNASSSTISGALGVPQVDTLFPTITTSMRDIRLKCANSHAKRLTFELDADVSDLFVHAPRLLPHAFACISSGIDVANLNNLNQSPVSPLGAEGGEKYAIKGESSGESQHAVLSSVKNVHLGTAMMIKHKVVHAEVGFNDVACGVLISRKQTGRRNLVDSLVSTVSEVDFSPGVEIVKTQIQSIKDQKKTNATPATPLANSTSRAKPARKPLLPPNVSFKSQFADCDMSLFEAIADDVFLSMPSGTHSTLVDQATLCNDEIFRRISMAFPARIAIVPKGRVVLSPTADLVSKEALRSVTEHFEKQQREYKAKIAKIRMENYENEQRLALSNAKIADLMESAEGHNREVQEGKRAMEEQVQVIEALRASYARVRFVEIDEYKKMESRTKPMTEKKLRQNLEKMRKGVVTFEDANVQTRNSVALLDSHTVQTEPKMENSIRELQTEIGEREKEVNKLNSSISRLQLLQNQTQAHNNAMRQDNSELEGKVRRLEIVEKEFKSRTDEAKSIEKEMKDLEAKTRQLIKEIRFLRAENIRLQDVDVDDEDDDYDDLEADEGEVEVPKGGKKSKGKKGEKDSV